MKKLTSLIAVVLLAACATCCEAGIEIDDFSDASTASNLQISREFSGNAFLSVGNGIQVFEFGSVTYSVAGGLPSLSKGLGTFGDISSDFENGVVFSNVSSTFGSNFYVSLYVGLLDRGGSSQPLGSGPLFFDVDLSDASEFTIEIFNVGLTRSGGSGIATLGGSLSAVPEPTSLILVGVACIPVLVRRKRS